MFLIWIFLFYALIAGIWQLAEKKFYGKKSPRLIDDFVAVILAVSLYLNFS